MIEKIFRLKKHMQLLTVLLMMAVIMMIFQGCGVYSFSGASIPKDIKTVSIVPMVSVATNAPQNLERIMTDEVRNKLSVESGLALVNRDGDYDFSGKITRYTVAPINPTDGSFATKNRITITVEVAFINSKDAKSNWNQSFTRYVEFQTQNLSAVETALLTDVSKQIAQDIFNKALANW